jgi:hypothetical protein
VLPLWRDKVRFVLCKDRLIVLHYQSGRRPHILSKQVFPYTGQETGWQPLLALLDSVLKGKEWKAADAMVVLSNHFVRFLVLPWNEAILSGAEKMALVQHRFDEVYGEASADWDFRLSEGSFGAASIACAIPQKLLSQLKAIFENSSLRLKLVQPYLMTAFNACRRELGKEPTWFVLAERDNICVGLLHKGHWSSIRLRHVVTDWFEEAMLMLEREALLAKDGSKFSKVFVLAPETSGLIRVKREPWTINQLNLNTPLEISPAEMPNYAMAAAGM